MSRLRWPDSTNSVSEKPGTIQSAASSIGWESTPAFETRALADQRVS